MVIDVCGFVVRKLVFLLRMESVRNRDVSKWFCLGE